MSDAPGGSEDREAKFGGPPPARTLEQRWVLATQGVLTELNRTSHLRVGGEPRPSHSNLSAFRLREHWGVRSAREARQRIRWLLDEGHRFALARDADRSPDELLAWDLVRASCVAGWSHVAYHLELEEAWAAMLEAARGLRAGFTSWREVGASYGAGKSLWSGAPSDDVTAITARLVTPGGWWDLPWETDLGGTIPAPAPEPLPELVVDPTGADGAFRTIGEAVGSTRAPKRVRVRAGVYDESVRVKAPVELVAEGDVTVRNGDGAPLSLDHHAYVRGFRLEAGHDEAGQKMQAVWVGANFARVEDCVLETERCGIYGGKKRAEIIAERVTVSRPGIHGFMIEGGAHLTILDSTVTAPTGSGVVTEGDGELHVEGLTITDGATPALSVHGDNRVELRSVTVTGCASHAMQILGSSVLSAFDLTMKDNRGAGALFGSKSQAPSAIHGGVLTGNAGNDVGVLSGGVSVHGAELGGGPACAVAVQNEGRLQLEGCTIAPTTHPLLWLMGRSLTVVLDSRLRNEGELAVFADSGSEVRLAGCDITTEVKTAIVLRGVRSALLLGGTITSADGCVHADQGSVVDVRDVALRGTGTADDGSPPLAVTEGADLAVVGGRIEAAGPRAVIVESGGRASFTRAAIAAPAGVAFALDGGDVRLLGGSVVAASPALLEGEARLSAAGTEVSPASGVEPLPLDATAIAPFEVSLDHHGRAALAVDPDALRPAFAPLGVEPDVGAAVAWIELALDGASAGDGLVIGGRFGHATVATDDLPALARVAARLKGVLGEPATLQALAERLRAQAEDEGGEAEADA